MCVEVRGHLVGVGLLLPCGVWESDSVVPLPASSSVDTGLILCADRYILLGPQSMPCQLFRDSAVVSLRFLVREGPRGRLSVLELYWALQQGGVIERLAQQVERIGHTHRNQNQGLWAPSLV